MANPTSFGDVITRTVMGTGAAFVAFIAKEYIETKRPDVAQCFADALWVAGALLLMNLVLYMIAPKKA